MKSPCAVFCPRYLPSAVALFSLVLGACSSPPEPQAAPAAAPEPSAAPEPTAYVPGPSADDIRGAVDGCDAELRQCYLLGTFKNSQLTGTVNVTFTIGTTGKVSETSDAGSDIPDPEVVKCVLDVVAELEFPAGASSETEVTYPIRFGSHG